MVISLQQTNIQVNENIRLLLAAWMEALSYSLSFHRCDVQEILCHELGDHES